MEEAARADEARGTAAGAPSTTGLGAALFEKRYYALVLLTLVYVSNYVDRQILSILLPAIKKEFVVSDAWLGFITGVGFAIFYATLAIPIAFLADRMSRKKIIVASLSIFSIMTALCGVVGQFWQLALCRIGVGIGEAGSSPPSHAIISDLYAPKERGTAMGVFSIAVNLGIMIGFFGGGWINYYFGWRPAFLAAGIPGIMLALIVAFTLREPPRGRVEGLHKNVSQDAPTFFQTVGFLWKQSSFRNLALGAALQALVGYAMIIWVASYLQRTHGLDSRYSGTFLALTIGILGGAGTFLGGYLADRMGKKDVRWNMWLTSASVVVMLPFLWVFLLTDNTMLAYACYMIPAALTVFYLAPCLAMTQGLVAVRMRAFAGATLYFIINIIGMGIGPQLTGFLSDWLRPSFGDDSLRYALFIVSFFWIWSALHFYLAARTLERDLARAKSTSGVPEVA